VLDVLKTRRSIRKYTDEMPRDEDLERIVEAGLYAPLVWADRALSL